jgi:hypothetical protein
MTPERQKIMKIIKKMHPSDAIALIESIDREIRKENSIRIAAGKPIKIDERPDTITLTHE